MKETRYQHMYSQLHSSVDEKEIVMKKNHSNVTRIVTVALAAALVLALSVGAVAATSRRLQDTLLRQPEAKQTQENPSDVPGASNSYDPLEPGYDMISLQGYAGSPEYLAAVAWAEFESGYDRDGAILDSVGNAATPWDEKYGYNGYSVYSQDMADAMDAICAQYGLGLHFGGINVGNLEERFGEFASAGSAFGYYYGDGTFQYDGTQDGIEFQFRRTMKGVLDTVYLNVTDWTTYSQWEYETRSGVTVLLALGPMKALILAELDDCFVAANVLVGSEGSDFVPGATITESQLEAFADTFDFSIL